jgi:hypothetical protein
MAKRPKTPLPPEDMPNPEFAGLADKETAVKAVWANLQAAHEAMSEGFPSHWDAFWYGTFSCVFHEMAIELGDKEAGRLVGKKALKRFMEEHDVLLEQMFTACHRYDGSDEDFDEDDDEGPSAFLFTRRRKP